MAYTEPTSCEAPDEASPRFEAALSAKESIIEAFVDIAQEVSTTSAFFKRALPALAKCLRCAYAEVEIRSGSTILNESWHHENSDPAFWSDTVATLMTETMAELKTQARIFEGLEVDVKVAFLCAPIGMHSRTGGGLIAVMPCRDSSEVDEYLDLLDVLCTLASSLIDTLGKNVGAESSGNAASQDEISRIRKVSEFTTETELAFAITNKLRTRDGSEQVILSRVQGTKATLLSLSGNDTIAPRSPGVKLIRSAVEECVDLGKTVVDQEQDLATGADIITGGRLHRTWRESVGGGCVASIPLFQDSKLVAVLSVRRSTSQPFNREELEELHGLVEPYATGLEMVRVARRSLLQHVKSSVGGLLGTFFGPASHGRKAAALASVLFLGWAFYGQIPYSIQAPCELVPATSRQLAAGSDGVLAASFVLPGDIVEQGDLLCEFDSSELELEKARLQGELAIFEVDRFSALDGGSPAEVELASANGRAVRANLALTEYRISASKVYATTDGIVLEGDHRSRIGDAFSKGEPLFKIAPSEGWKLEIRVPEAEIISIEQGMSGEFASHSRPEDSFEFEVSRMAPSAESLAGNNVFIVEANCDVSVDWARSGMEGFASIDAGERTPAWVLFHRAIDFARLHLWL